jgi:hypothetical protein
VLAALVLFCVGLSAAFLACGFVYLSMMFPHDEVVQRAVLYGAIALASFGGALWSLFTLRRRLSHPHSESS